MNVWYQRHKILIVVAGTVGILLIGYVASWLGTYVLFDSLTGKIHASTGLDIWLARAVAVALTVVLLLVLPLLIPFYPKRRIRMVVGVVAAIAFCIGMFFATQEVYFNPATGHPVKYFIRTPGGFKFSSTPGFDSQWGIRYEPITPEVAREIGVTLGLKDQKLPSDVLFDPVTGHPLKNYYKDSSGKIELFPLVVKYHPQKGDPLVPTTPEIAREYAKQQEGATRKPIMRAEGEKESPGSLGSASSPVSTVGPRGGVRPTAFDGLGRLAIGTYNVRTSVVSSYDVWSQDTAVTLELVKVEVAENLTKLHIDVVCYRPGLSADQCTITVPSTEYFALIDQNGNRYNLLLDRSQLPEGRLLARERKKLILAFPRLEVGVYQGSLHHPTELVMKSRGHTGSMDFQILF